MNLKEKATAPVSSVGADGKQPLNNYNKESIADLPVKGNLQATESCPVKSEKMQNKDELQTVSMTELYDTVYPPKIPIVDGLIYAGTYLFVGAPQSRQILLYGTAWLPCKHGNGFVGLSGAKGYGFISCP